MITSASPQSWITGEEFAAERNRLRKMGLVPFSPEYEALVRRVDERNEYLWRTYLAPLLETYAGKWAGVGLQGEPIIGETAVSVAKLAEQRFGPGDFYLVQLTPDRGPRHVGVRRG